MKKINKIAVITRVFRIKAQQGQYEQNKNCHLKLEAALE